MKLLILLAAVVAVALAAPQSYSVDDANSIFTVRGIHKAIQVDGKSCYDIIESFLRRGAKYNARLRAVINFNGKALAQAQELDDYYRENKKLIGRLHCVPAMIKDNLDVAGLPSTGAIKALRYSIPNKDSLIVERLRKEGAIVVGKANLAELGDGPRYNTEMGGICRNPFDAKRSCGISSSGSGASGSTGLSVIQIGTDTEGSIIEPATFNNLFGIRPAYDFGQLVGMVPGLQKIDAIGPMCKSLNDMVLAYSIINNDQKIWDDFSAIQDSQSKLRVGVLQPFLEDFDIGFMGLKHEIEPEVRVNVEKALGNMEQINVAYENIDLSPELFQAFSQTLIKVITNKGKCANACAKQSWNNYFGDEERFDHDAPYHSFEEFLNSPTLSAHYKEYYAPANIDNPSEACASQCGDFDAGREEFRKFTLELMENFDVLAFPSVSALPYVLRPEIGFQNFNRVSALFFSPYSGLAAVNIPVGNSPSSDEAPNGLPVGLTLLTTNENLLKAFTIAQRYDSKFIKGVNRNLPGSYP